MKGWRVWVLCALLVSLPLLFAHSSSPGLLADTDTAFLLKTIRERQAPLSWFAGDWPLGNHFYRPLPTLSFELDNALYGTDAAGYGWTNAILCALCSVALLWLLAELFGSPLVALGGAGLFTAWTLGWGEVFSLPLYCVAGGVVLVGLYRHSLGFGRFIPAALVLVFLSTELAALPVSTGRLGQFVVQWLPGRTATVMCLFALVALAAYVRFERARDRRLPLAAATSMDPPLSTRSSVGAKPGNAWAWFAVSAVAVAGALASYEQAVMLPAVLLGVAVFLRWRRSLPAWGVHAVYWALLVGYLVLRHFIIPSSASSYQDQQLRFGPGVASDLMGYLAPNLWQVMFAWIAMSESLIAVITAPVAGSLLLASSTITTAFQARRHLSTVLTGYLLSALAFLPMAWLKQFGHYHYWPMALRTVFVIGLVKVAWDLLSIAASPPERRAPLRPSPAPGSLPHR